MRIRCLLFLAAACGGNPTQSNSPGLVDNTCTAKGNEQLPLDAPSPLGFKPVDVLPLALGARSAQLTYLNGETTTLDYEVVPGSVAWVTRYQEESCHPAVVVPSTVQFRSMDGRFDENLSVDLLLSSAKLMSWEVTAVESDLRGTFRAADIAPNSMLLDPSATRLGFLGLYATGVSAGTVDASSISSKGDAIVGSHALMATW